MKRGNGWVGGQRKEFTVFVSNIPEKLDQFGLKGIFQRVGRVIDSYIPPRRSRRTSTRYGFVRFWRQDDATRCINSLNNAIIRGSRISVCMAKFDKIKGGSRGSHRSHMIENKFNRECWRKKHQVQVGNQEVMKGGLSDDGPHVSLSLKGDVNSDFTEWLSRSLVCTSEEPRDLATLSSALVSGFGECTKICAISSFKFILTMPSHERVDELLRNHEELDLWFVSIKKWDKYDFCETRRVWLEIFGVPPHGWTWENFKNIANIWGRFVCLGKSIGKTESFASMKVLIDTDRFYSIEADMILSIEDSGYRLRIKEVGPTVQMLQGTQVPCSSSSTKALTSNHGVVGFEDLDDVMPLGDDVECSNWRRNVNITAEQDRVAINESPEVQINSNIAREGARIVGSPSISIHSQSRTRTACFSHIGDSEEVIKNTKHLCALETSVEQEEPLSNGKQPNSLMSKLNEHHALEVPHAKDFNAESLGGGEVQSDNLPHPPGFEPQVDHIVEESGGISSPLGFEDTTTAEVGSVRKGKTLKSHIDLIGKRVTRSQTKQSKVSEAKSRSIMRRSMSGEGGREGNPQGTTSANTPDSIRKLAEESIEIGELLGLKVIGKKDIAVKRLTRSLKSARASRPIH